ncbi:alpha/beta-hydrolase like protein [Zymoseptoria brevis]|uniref:Alpha/beta-hydrolase like protein n=1 Tax=Zymoseptoria brevis TaxID=1047168 RepID=A0A0F4GCF7_9PEZI|nr:alpha/beta-hydrolase like protein [Zymoseptoria brevis]
MTDKEKLHLALQIVGDAISVDPDDLQDQETWKYLGLGDLLAQATAADLKQAGIHVPDDVFTRYDTVGALKTFFHPKQDAASVPTTAKQLQDPWQDIPKPKIPLSVVLQGKPFVTPTTMFLFPDGSGAGTSYASIPPISPFICLIGLNSPFLRQAEHFTCSIEHLARLWLSEVKKLQPPGRPYVLGGWSAGGYYAYEVAKLLVAEGKMIERLILIDSPCRLVYEALPEQVVAELTKKGLMGASGAKKAPEWLVQHFTSTVLAVDRYMPVPMEGRDVPAKVNFVWVKEGLVDDVEKSGLEVNLSVKVTKFLLEPREELNTEGWERLLPGAEYSVDYMTGNHFQITQPPHSDSLGQILRKLLTS